MYDFPVTDARGQVEADAAKVKAQAATRDATKAAADAAEAARLARAATPKRYYGLRREGGRTTYAELPLTPERELLPDRPRRLQIDDLNYEHIETDRDGVWIYREM